ncbi:twin-arginine translocation signal domain-containing protein, partial [bacterium]|nr:twin-arginine translocation signal domain-containing protein [bacterium]
MEKNPHVSGKTSRRNFLKAAAAAAICGPHVVRSSVLAASGKPGPNDQ